MDFRTKQNRFCPLFYLAASICIGVLSGCSVPLTKDPKAGTLIIGAQSCQFESSELPVNTHLLSSQLIQQGEIVETDMESYSAPVNFCRIQGVIEQEIGFELWLPLPVTWNQRMLGAGVGGQAGSIAFKELVRGVSRGYASASTDTGHKKTEKHWLLKRPDRALNYAQRANHLLAQNVKTLIRTFYGRGPDKSFFIGCSGGGRQAMTEVQRYPYDYDAVIAGAPGVNTPEMSARRLWEIIQHDKNKDLLSPSDWQFIANKGREYCDLQDGFRDGIADNPLACDFDIASLVCGTQSTQEVCLRQQQVDFAKHIFNPLMDENGRQVDSGLLPGIEVIPGPVPEPFTPGPSYLATVLFADGVHSDPNWDVRSFNIAKDLAAIDTVMNLHADDPNIDDFISHNGKLILYHGWADPFVSPQSTIDYLQSLSTRYGGINRVNEFARLFMVPGMEHCLGGGVPDRIGGVGGLKAQQADPTPSNDLLSALEKWVYDDIPPERINAAKIENGDVKQTRPVCAYPKKAVYQKGPVEGANSYHCH